MDQAGTASRAEAGSGTKQSASSPGAAAQESASAGTSAGGAAPSAGETAEGGVSKTGGDESGSNTLAQGTGGLLQGLGGSFGFAGFAGLSSLPDPFACEEGYVAFDGVCEDMDECKWEVHHCDPKATCTNTPGSYTCTCPEGTTGNGFVCLEVAECVDGLCQNGGTCVASGKQLLCECVDGYAGTECEIACPDVLTFADPVIEQLVRAKLSQPDGDILYDDAKTLSSLEAFRQDISTLEGLQCLTGLTSIVLAETGITDLGPLAGLTKMVHVDLSCNDFTDISPLAKMVDAEYINLARSSSCPYQARVVDLSPLAGISLLDTLYADGNDIVDISPLRSLRFLHVLSLNDNLRLSDLTPASDSLFAVHVLGLSGTAVKDLTPLQGHSSLSDLDASNLGLNSLDALPVLPYLVRLNLAYNEIADVGRLEEFATLAVLLLDHNPITNVGPLVANSALDEGSEISLLATSLDCVAQRDNIATLVERGVVLTSDCN